MLGREGVFRIVGINFVLSVSSKISDQLVLSGVYLVNLGILGPSFGLTWLRSFSFFQAGFSSALTWFLNSLNSSNCMNLAALSEVRPYPQLVFCIDYPRKGPIRG